MSKELKKIIDIEGLKEFKEKLVADLTATSILAMVYPVGSVYISVNNVSPEKFLGGKWVKISQGRVLQGASGTQTAGTEVSAGLPNISVSWNGEHTHTRGSMNITGNIVMHGAGSCTPIQGKLYGIYRDKALPVITSYYVKKYSS